MKTNTVTTCKNEDTKEVIWHGRHSNLGMKNLERLAKDYLVEGLAYGLDYHRMQLFVNSTLVENSIEHLSQRQKESY